MVKILLAEDDEALRDGIICNLQMQFDNIGKEYKITGVPNGLAALEKLRNEKYDILITDNIMPEMNGLDLIVKAFDNKIAPKVIILMSGVVDGFDDYVKNIMLRTSENHSCRTDCLISCSLIINIYN